MFEPLLALTERAWIAVKQKCLLISFLLRNFPLVLLGPYGVTVALFSLSTDAFLAAPNTEADLVITTLMGRSVLFLYLSSIIATIWLLFKSMHFHPIFASFLLIAALPSYFAFIYTLMDASSFFICFDRSLSSVWEGLYFSIVTFTTLGYGDIIPLGTCRAIAATQALFGLFTIGVIPASIIASFFGRLEPR